MTFGEFIREKRDRAGISLRKLGERIDFSPVYISDLEKGKRLAIKDIGVLEEISKALRLSNTELQVLCDLAGKERGIIAPDVWEYMKDREDIHGVLRFFMQYQIREEELKSFMKYIARKRYEED